ncbi:MAG: FAD:protein FMN transferase [Nonlabens sp.]
MGCKQGTVTTTASGLQKQAYYGKAIGTSYSIQFFHSTDLEVTQPVDSIVDMFNKSMSTWVPSSLINQFNNGADSVLVGLPFKEVFDQAQVIYKATGGYFDPTVGNLVNAYGFGANGNQQAVPNQNKIDSLKSLVGFDQIKLTASKVVDSFFLNSARKGVYLEFNAIGKGTLVDYIAGYLERNGVTDFLVEVGGEVVARGVNQERNTPWAVGIDDPKKQSNNRNYISVVNLENRAMAGSGNYRKYKVDELTGKEYVHTVDPITGLARPSRILGVNVMAPSCTLADGYATAFMAMPLERSIKLMHSLDNIDVLIMHLDDNDMLRFEMTDGFKAAIKKEI